MFYYTMIKKIQAESIKDFHINKDNAWEQNTEKMENKSNL